MNQALKEVRAQIDQIHAPTDAEHTVLDKMMQVFELHQRQVRSMLGERG